MNPLQRRAAAALLAPAAAAASAAERALDKAVVVNAPLDQAWAAWTPREGIHQLVPPYNVGWGDGGVWDRAYAYFDRAWTSVLDQLKTRFDEGPSDWAPWLEQLRQARRVPLAE